MAERAANAKGAYDVLEAARLLGIGPRTLASWARPSASGLPPVVEPSLGWAYSFHDLVTLAMAAVLRQRGVQISGVRKAHHYLQGSTGLERPFASEEIVKGLATAWGSVITAEDGVDMTKHGQMVLLGVVEEYLVPLSYDDARLARLWRPESHVLLDPAIQVGQPCVAGSRVTTATVAGRYGQGENLREICDDLDLTLTEARSCLKFEDRLTKGQGLAMAPAA
jgi:uncharacterized protein (DUF433 family)